MSKLGIDIGNYAVKTSTDDIFESKVTEVKTLVQIQIALK